MILPISNKRLRQRVQRSATAQKSRREFDPVTCRKANKGGVIGIQRAPSAMTPETLDDKSRTVRALAFTEVPVEIYDWKSDRIVGEVLTVAGMRDVDSVRLLDSHSRYAAANVLGSATDFREEAETDLHERGGSLTLQFSAASDVEPIWTRVKEGHLRGISIGGSYRRGSYTEIEKGGVFTWAGVTYEAVEMPLRIVTNWELVEVSVVPIPADGSAIIRSRQTETQTSVSDSKPHTGGQVARNSHAANVANRGDKTMHFSERAIRLLRSFGLSKDDAANHDATVAFCRTLSQDQLAELFERSPRAKVILEGDAETERSATGPSQSSSAATQTATQQATATPATDAESIRRAERERVEAIRRMGAGIRQEVVERAINENWTEEQAGYRFFQETRRSAPRGVSQDPQRGAPGVHVQRGPTLETLQVGMLLRHGISPDSEVLRSGAAQVILGREAVGADWLVRSNRQLSAGQQLEDRFARAIDEGQRYRSYSAVDFCRAALELSGRQVPHDREEIIQRAMSTNSLNRIFGTAVNARIITGYLMYEDSTRGWVAETDWQDHRSNQPVALNAGKGLTRRTTGMKAAHVEISDSGETYKVEPYCGQIAIDIVDIRNDSAGFTGTLPEFLGEEAAKVRPDLVYAILLANAALASDSVALFSSSRYNANDMTSNALSSSGLTAVENRMAGFYAKALDGSVKPLNMMAGFLIVPRTLRQTAIRETQSPLMVSGNTTAAGNVNPHNGEYQVRSDARLDTGFTSPITGAVLTGSTTKWYVAERSGRRTISVGYLAGTGRAPLIRSGRFNSPGQYGLWWDVEMPLGAGVISPDGIIRSAA